MPLTLKFAENSVFPRGTTVDLYGDDHELQYREKQPPAGTPIATATVSSKDGTLTFATGELDWSTGYYLHALVGGQHRWVQTRTIDPSRRIRATEVFQQEPDDTADIFEYRDDLNANILWLDGDGAFGVGPNPSFRIQGERGGDYPATDFFMDSRPLKGKAGTGNRGGTGRMNMRSFGVYMVNDPPDGNFHRAQGSPSGNFFDVVRTYEVGTVSATNGSDIVNGAGVNWTANVNGRDNVMVGDAITIAGDTQTRTVSVVISATQLKLASAYQGPTGSGRAYNLGGHVEVHNGENTVQGVDTRWTTDLIDDALEVGGSSVDYRIVDVDVTNQVLILSDAFGENSVGEAAYVIGFDGYPYGRHGDGSEMYPCKSGAILMTLEGIPFMPAGSFSGGVSRISMSCSEDPFQHVLDGHLKQPWAHGDASVKVDVNPAAFHIRQPDTTGADQGTYPIREHGRVVITKDNGRGVVVTYKAWAWDSGTQTGYLLGCTESDSSGVGASIGKLVTQTRLHVGGTVQAVTVPNLGYRLGWTGWKVFDDGGMAFGGQGSRSAWHHIKGGSVRTELSAVPSGFSYSFAGTSPGATSRNYYFIFKNTSPGATFADTCVIKCPVPDGQSSYGLTGYLQLALSGLPANWLCYDVVWCLADGAGADTGAYKLIAQNVSVRDDNKQNAVAAVDYGQILNGAYVMPTSNRNTSADVWVGGLLRCDGGRAGGVRRITTTTPDGRVAGQMFSIDGREEVVSVETTGTPLDIYLPSSGSVPGRMFEIIDKAGGAGANALTVHAIGTDSIEGAATDVINVNRGGARYISNGFGAWLKRAALAGTPLDVSIIDAKGDLIVGTADNVASRKAVGANNTGLFANSAQATGVEWRQLVNADVAAGAAIAYSKLALATSIVNGDVAAGAAIAYTKLALANSIVNGDIAAGAGIAYSKLNLASSIVGTDLAAALSTRIPTQAQADALAGTQGSPSSTNPYVTQADRNTNIYGKFRPLKASTMRLRAADVAGAGILLDQVSGKPVVAATTDSAWQMVYLDSADETISGLTPKIRLVAAIGVNDTAPAVTFTLGLYSVGTPSGGVGVWNPNPTLVGSTGVAFASPAANSKSTQSNSGDVAYPAAGFYVIGVNVSGVPAANSQVEIIYRLEVHHV